MPQIPIKTPSIFDGPAHDRLQFGLRNVISNIGANTIMDGQLIKNISVTSGVDFIVGHTLNRQPLGYLVVGVTGANQITVRAANGITNNTTLTLTPSATGVISLWVF